MKQRRFVDMISRNDTAPREKMYLPALVNVIPIAIGSIMRLFCSSCFSWAMSLTMLTFSLKFSALSSASLCINRPNTCVMELCRSPVVAAGFVASFYSEICSLVIVFIDSLSFSEDPVSYLSLRWSNRANFLLNWASSSFVEPSGG